MGHRWGWAAACAAAFICLSAAPGYAAPSAREAARLEKQRAAEVARAKALKAEAEAARARAKALAEGLKTMDVQQAETRAARIDAEAERAALAAVALTLAQRQADDRRTLERLLARAILTENAARSPFLPPTAQPDLVRTGALMGFAVEPLAARAVAAQRDLNAARARVDALEGRRAELAAADAQLTVARLDAAAKLGAVQILNAQLLADAAKAEKAAAKFAKEAKSLKDLTAKVSASPSRKLTASGPRVVPAAGEVATRYGAKVDGAAARGLTLRTAQGAKVVAPANAVVGYAGPFRSYGQVLILDHGDGYALVLTGLSSVSTGAGKRVAAGETIGEMPSGAATAPELYFEVRQAGQPVDPERWLRSRG